MNENEYDTINLRYKVNFETNIYKNVKWVSVNTLGNTRFTNQEILENLKKGINEKKKSISNVYEAIQVLQLDNFKIINDDATYLEKKGKLWEFHRNGKSAFENNCGCCAACAAWGCYVLQSCYDEIGIITINSISGNGHALNYIYNGNDYFIFDLYVQSNTFNKDIPIETGKLEDFRKTKWITGIMIKVHQLEEFADFFSRYMYFRSKEYLFLKHQEHECSEVNISKKDETTIITFPRYRKIEKITTKKVSNVFSIQRI